MLNFVHIYSPPEEGTDLSEELGVNRDDPFLHIRSLQSRELPTTIEFMTTKRSIGAEELTYRTDGKTNRC